MSGRTPFPAVPVLAPPRAGTTAPIAPCAGAYRISVAQANLMLLLAAALWGFGNIAQKTVLEHVDPFSAVGLRCLIAGLLIAPLIAAERGQPAPGWVASLLRVGALFALALALQQAAYLDTSVTNASFLVNTATVMTPVAAWLLLRERPSAGVALAASMTLAGALLLCGGMGGEIGRGDLTAILSAACYALWMVELGRHARAYGRPVATAAAQFALTALLLLPAGMLQGGLTPAAVRAAAPELAVLGIFSTAIAFGLQTVAQRFTPASHAAVVVSSESLFGAAAAAFALGERISSTGAAGGLLMLVAIAIVAFPRPSVPRAGRRFVAVVAALALLGAVPARAESPAVDASIVTAIDISQSVPAADMRAQLIALAAAIRSPDFLAAIRRGINGRIWFGVFAWHTEPVEILPWRMIGSPGEAEAAARVVEARTAVNAEAEARGRRDWYIGRLTDLSRALDHAKALTAEAGAARVVVNVIGNGPDNVGEPAAAARDRLLATGAIVNGVVLGDDPAVADYYRREVVGGAGAFLMTNSVAPTLTEAMRRKLIMDLVAALN